MQQDRANTEQLSVELAPLYASGQMNALQQRLEVASGELGGRMMVLDLSGKVQADSFSELNGSRVELPEVLSILVSGKTIDYGVHKTTTGEQTNSVLRFLRPYDQNSEWVGYATSALTTSGITIGVLIFASPIQEMMERLFTLQDQMVFYFLIAAAAALIIALVFSRIITRPIASLTRSIQRMGRGDLSVRVPVRGSGELRKLSETFNTMSEKLEMLDKSRNQFVSNASHELKTPLATMKILLESIIYQPEMDEGLRTEFLTDVNEEINRLNLIISDLLALVSMDSKTLRLNRTTFNFSQLVSDSVERLKPMATKRKQEIKVQLGDRCEMYADFAKLTQVVYNIMDNALKYTPEGGTVRVRLIRSGRDAILTVSDTGPGIPKEDQALIFDRFYRVDKARSRDTGGTGLGLSIVHQMVLMHGGNVSVDSEEGQGSTFTVELPIHQA
ncbi:MAG: cell wall metabolism sensor histidine kinase WalK [Clostridiales bacterium]|nr:cell wall metabolism sensor histidine kinase WalK [Clostridiales bacterium]